MPKHPESDGRKRFAPSERRGSAFQVITGLLILALPTWALVTAAEAPANAVAARTTAPNATTPQGMPANSPGKPAAAATSTAPAPAAATSGLAGAYGLAIALQGAVVVHDWGAARRHLDALKAIKTEAPRNAAERSHLAAVTPLLDGLSASISSANARLANEQAYRLATALMLALDARAPMSTASIGGGGGGQAVSSIAQPSASLEHLRQASDAAAQAQVALINHDTQGAKTQLDAVREHLKGASAATTSPRLKGWIDGLDKQRWRVVANLSNPARAYRSGVYLSRGLIRTLRYEGRQAATAAPAPAGGGGGGARQKPKPMMQDVPPPTHANAPRRGAAKQMALEETPYDKRDVR